MMDIQALQAQLDAAQASFDHAVLMLCSSVAFGVALVVGIAVHELGYVVMARHAEMPIRMMRLGTGPVLLRWRFGHTWLVDPAP